MEQKQKKGKTKLYFYNGKCLCNKVLTTCIVYNDSSCTDGINNSYSSLIVIYLCWLTLCFKHVRLASTLSLLCLCCSTISSLCFYLIPGRVFCSKGSRREQESNLERILVFFISFIPDISFIVSCNMLSSLSRELQKS